MCWVSSSNLNSLKWLLMINVYPSISLYCFPAQFPSPPHTQPSSLQAAAPIKARSASNAQKAGQPAILWWMSAAGQKLAGGLPSHCACGVLGLKLTSKQLDIAGPNQPTHDRSLVGGLTEQLLDWGTYWWGGFGCGWLIGWWVNDWMAWLRDLLMESVWLWLTDWLIGKWLGEGMVDYLIGCLSGSSIPPFFPFFLHWDHWFSDSMSG